MPRFIAALAFVLLLAANSAAAPSETTMTIDDLLAGVGFREMAFSPDGHWLVWSVSRPDQEKNQNVGDLYRLDLRDDKAEARRLTNGSSSDGSPRWSPDGQWIGFISRRGKDDAKSQVWRIPVDGGEAEVVTKWPPGVGSFRWAADGAILFTAEEAKTAHDRALEKAKDDVRVVEDREHWKAVRLYSLDLESKKVTRLTLNDDRIEGFWLRRDGRAVVTRHVVSIYETSQIGGPRSKYFVHDLDSGESKEILNEEIFDPSRVEFSSDGSHLFAQWYYSRLNSDDLKSSAGISTLWSIDLESGARTRITLGEDMGVADNVRNGSWHVVDDGLIAIVANKTVGRPVRIDARGDSFRVRDLNGDGIANWFGLAVDVAGKHVVAVHSRANDPDALVLGRLSGTKVRDLRVIHDPNDPLRKKVTRSEVITWESSKDGAEINGILHYPKGFDPEQTDRKWPLMLWIHGGPTGIDADSFENYWASFPHLLAERGMFVLQPNYRGSSNHGLDFVESITGGNYYSYEIPDILSGVDHLIDRGWVHPDSLGTKGWSNGAILTIQLTIETDRFKVACAGAGDVNWTSDFGNCAFGPNFDVTYLGSAPWENPELYVSKSPFFRLTDVTTPTLIQFGEKDTSVPTEQGWQHYRALQLLDRAAVRFLVYPGMGHGLTKLSYQRRKIEEDLAWIDRHLFGRTPPPTEDLKDGSPLELALGRMKLAGAEHEIGMQEGGNLLPLVDAKVLSEEHAIRFGRTEVTRAQFFSFLRSPQGSSVSTDGLTGWNSEVSAFAPGTGNLPVTGVSFDVAHAYANWLSMSTGGGWRLPLSKEWDAAAAEASAAAENNLCYWAGYAPTPDEAARLRARVTGRLGVGQLLRPVASSGAKASQRFYDLQGNAAEWTLDGAAGPGVLRGRTVLDGCDEATPIDAATDPMLFGLRVVLEVK